MTTKERLAVIAKIAKDDSNIGKTGMMKLLYLLQTVYGLPLGYDFQIYTYGPYCQTVMSDIEYAEFIGYIQVLPVTYSGGMGGYQISTKTEGGEAIKNASGRLSEYTAALEDVIHKFGKRSAKELELYSTIVFVTRSFVENEWEKSKEEVCSVVQRIKPHFQFDTIQKAYDELEDMCFLDTKGIQVQ